MTRLFWLMQGFGLFSYFELEKNYKIIVFINLKLYLPCDFRELIYIYIILSQFGQNSN